MLTKDLFSVNPWPWQERGVEETISLYDRVESVCLHSPTGGGKSKMMWAIVKWASSMNLRVGVLTNRNSLCRQLHADMEKAGIDHGVVASKMKQCFDLSKPVQLIMVQSELAQVKRRSRTHVDILIVDEAHLFQGGACADLIRQHKESGTYVIQVTATPVGLYRTCDDLIVAGTNSELREHGAHVPCLVKAPSEFDCEHVKRTVTGEFVVGDMVRKIWNQQIVGHVYDHWIQVNPKMEPTICFGPDCPSSLWLAKEFENRGVRVAYVEAKKVYWDGEERSDSDGKLREMIFGLVREGEIPILFNRFVCREGLDFPNLRHAILATPIGSLKSFVQTVGRLLRYSEQTPDLVHLTDHGGNCRRHGSPNADRDWARLFKMTEQEVYREQKKADRKKKSEDIPITCPRCKTVRASGNRCPDPPFGCGHESKVRQRFVMQTDGTLKTINESEMKPKKFQEVQPSQKLWDRLYWSQVKSNGNLTFEQLSILFNRQTGMYPPSDLKRMPIQYGDEKKNRVAGYPLEKLRR